MRISNITYVAIIYNMFIQSNLTSISNSHHCVASFTLSKRDLHTPPNFSSIVLSLQLVGNLCSCIVGHFCSLILRLSSLIVSTACFHPHLASLIFIALHDALIFITLIIELCLNKKYKRRHPTTSGLPFSLLNTTGHLVRNRTSKDGTYMNGCNRQRSAVII